MPPSSTTSLPLASVSVLIIVQMILKRVHRETYALQIEYMSGMTLGPPEQSRFNWRGSIPARSASCYEGGACSKGRGLMRMM
ncbi:hypothetical protein JB92DRAFT_2969403 [Gautieria morchelliformis]|nr:hypothetical protein JB92DRAFT_2969403 [Gautieria morchelliformis]